jgi:FkbM family methyltransferase
MSQESPRHCSYPLRHRIISALRDLDVKGIRWLAHRLPGWLLPESKGPCIMQTLYGFPLQIDPVRDSGLERSIWETGTYEKGSLAVMADLLRPGDVFVDVGANIGLMSVFAARLVGDAGKVFAFEPHPETCGILDENIRLNGCSNIEVSRMAIGSKPGHARIYIRRDANRGEASLIQPETLDRSPETSEEGLEIELTTLDAFFADKVPAHMIKLDIEGYELEAMEGARGLLTSEQPPMLIVECSVSRENTFGESTDALWDFLMELGHYRIFRGTKDKSRVSKLVEIKKRKDLPSHDNIYAFTGVHLDSLSRRLFA